MNDPGQQPARQAVSDHHERARRQRRLDRPQREPVTQQGGRGDERADVEQRAAPATSVAGSDSGAHVSDSAVHTVISTSPAMATRPGVDAGSGRGRATATHQHEHPGHDRSDEPRPVEVPAGEEREHRRAGEEHRGRGQQDAATHRAAI